MKKVVKITAIVIAAIVALLAIVPFALRGKIDQIVEREAEAMLNAELSFEKLGISLLRHFPNASLDLEQLAIVGVDKFAGDTLVSADRISVVVDLMSIFSDSFEVGKLILDKPSVLAMKLKTGEVNWDIMKPSDQSDTDTTATELSSFKLSMKDIRINSGRLIYVDSLSDISFYTDRLDLKMKGDLSAAQSEVALEMDTKNIYCKMGKMVMLNKAELGLDIDVLADLENSKFTFKDNKIKLNAMEVAIDGWVAMPGEAIDMDIKLLSDKVEFKELLSMVPAFYTKDFKNLSASGQLSLEAWAKGKYERDLLPAFDARLSVNDGSFKYASLPKSVDNINIKASATSAGGSADNTILSVEKFSFAVAGNPVSATLYATTPVSDMNFNATADGKLNLGLIKEVYPLGDSVSLSGTVMANVGVAGRMSDIEKERYEKINANGSFSIENMVAKLAGLPPVEIAKMDATISPKALILGALQAKIGRSDLSASGSLTNYIAYALRDDKLSGSLFLTSKLLDLNELMGDSESTATEQASTDTSVLKVFVVPENLNLSLSAGVSKIEFAKMNITNFSGHLSVANGAVKMDKLEMNAMDGKIAMNGSYSTASNPESPRLVANVNISGCSFEQTFKELDVIKSFVPLFEKTGGNYSMKLDLTTNLNAEMAPELTTLSAKGVIESSNIHVQNIKAFDVLASTLKDDRLKKIEAKDMKISFTVENGKIYTSPFNLKLGDVNLNLSGTTGLDQTIDYTAKVTLPKAIGGVMSNVNVKIGGTFSSPKITLGVKEMAEDALKGALNQLVGDKATDVVSGSSEKLRAEAQATGDKLVEVARSEGEKLVAKAKNPLTKLAAQKSADLMVKKAQEQAQKLLDAVDAKTVGAE